MAKKKKGLSLEEKLEQALVPAKEQPYKVPENWCWVKIELLYENKTSGSKKIKTKDYEIEGRIPVIDQGQEFIGGYYNNEQMAYNEDLPVIIFGDHTRCVKYVDFNFVQGADGVKVLKPRGIEPKYFYYLLKNIVNNDLPDLGYRRHFPLFPQIIAPVATLEEQRRIVNVIESIFAKLDEAKEIAENIIEESLGYRASIYHAAFKGDLTKKWRTANCIDSETWKIKRFDEVAQIKSNLVDPSEYKTFPHIAPDNIEKRTGRLLEYRTIEEDGVTSGKHRFYQGQILYSKIRPYLSKLVVAEFDGLCSADMYPIEANENTKYLWYYMLSDDFLMQASSAGSRSVLPKINQKELSALKVSIPTVKEQEEIVRVLDRVLEKQGNMIEKTEMVMEQIEMMKKSILAKAFRGELGTNIESEESALELLRQILQEEQE